MGRKLILHLVQKLGSENNVSFGDIQKIFSGVQEVLVLALMLVSIFALLYVNMDIIYKVGVAVIVFSVIFLIILATQILRQEKEIRQQAAKPV
jgi:hypothetical protein